MPARMGARMLFWIVAGTLAALVAAVVARPLLAPPPPAPGGSPDQAIYQDQLAEVDRDLGRGVIGPEEAERARVEIARRLLAADRAGPPRLGEAPPRAALAAAATAAVVVVLGGLLLYAGLGRPGAEDQPLRARLAEAEQAFAQRPTQAEAEARAAAAAPEVPPPPADVAATIESLRAAAEAGEAGVQELGLLVAVEARMGRFAEAARAQERLIALRGEGAGLQDHAFLLDFMVAAAGGEVSREAQGLLLRMAEADPTHPAVRYYTGLLYGTTGRPDLGFPFWRALVEEAPADDPYRRMAAGGVEDLAWLAGVDYQPPAAPGPTEADIAAAAEMDPEAREEMIRGMVGSLEGRLAAQGGPAADWARLVSSLAVLGESDRAAAILAEARGVFAGDAAAQALLDEAAAEAGISE